MQKKRTTEKKTRCAVFRSGSHNNEAKGLTKEENEEEDQWKLEIGKKKNHQK